MKNNHLKFEYIMISTWFIGVMAIKFMLPALPTIAAELNISTTLAKYTISIFLFGKAMGMLFFGPFSEQYGRKICMLIGLSLFTVGNILAYFSNNIELLLVARLVQGLGTSATILMGRTMINDRYKGKKAASVFSNVFFIASIIICFLPFIGSTLTNYLPWKIIFIIMASYTLAIFILALFFLKESKQTNENFQFSLSKIFTYYKTIIVHPIFLGYVLCSVFMIGGESAFNTASSFLLMKSFQLSKQSFGMIMTLLTLGHLIGTILCGRVINKYQLSSTMGFGVLILASSSMIMTILIHLGFNSLFVLIVPMIIFYIGTGFVMTITAVGAVVPFPHLIGVSSAASLWLNFSFSASSSAIMSHLSTKTAEPVSILIALFGLAAFLSWYFFILRNEQAQIQSIDSIETPNINMHPTKP